LFRLVGSCLDVNFRTLMSSLIGGKPTKSLLNRAGPRHRPGMQWPRALAGRAPPKKKLRLRAYIKIFGIWGVCIVKFTESPKHVERLC